MLENWQNLGNSINSAFFFVLNKIISLQDFFIEQAWNIGRIVLLIALLSAGLNYALTGQGLKENMIKIMKATVFFFIVVAAYPRIIGWITNYSYELAYKSVGGSVKKYFDGKVENMNIIVSDTYMGRTTYHSLAADFYQSTPELSKIFSSLTKSDKVNLENGTLAYTSIAPAGAIHVLLLLAYQAFEFADAKDNFLGIPEFSKVIKGLACGLFLILTGVFALLEYLVCLLEFMLVASVGVILFPLSIWEGSKFLSEKYIGAIVGFFMKLLFCNIAIFLLLYGFISMFHALETQGFTGSPDQFAFIIFSCLLFFYICKSAPGIAQSLLTGTPSLSATGAISAVAGAVGAVKTAASLTKKAGGAVANTAGSVIGGGARAIGGIVASHTEAKAAKEAAENFVADAGGTEKQQKQAGNKAYHASRRRDIADSFRSGALDLARSISGDKNGGSSGGGGGTNPHSWRQDFNNNLVEDKKSGGMRKQTIAEHLDKRKIEGKERGIEAAGKFISRSQKKMYKEHHDKIGS
jgi:hypothetical protein